MLSLPVVFLCNAFLFLAILNSRFRMLTTLIISGAAYALSLAAGAVIAPALNDVTGQIANGVCVFLLLAAAVFLYTNSIAQKIFVAILLICNYSFLLPLTEHLLGALPFGASGFSAILIGAFVYLFFSFLSLITFVRPLHYFANRGVSVLSVGLCCAQALCLFVANGSIPALLGIESFAPRFFLTVFLYLIIAFAVRASFSAARFKESECTADYRDALLHAEADYFNAMVGGVTNARTARDHYGFILNEISDCARRGDCEGVLNAIADEAALRDPLLAHYSENTYINAVMASKAAYAKHCGIRLESNVELGATRLKTIEFCVILNDMLTYAIERAEQSGLEDKLVRMTVLPVEDRITFETVYSAAKKKKKRVSLTSKSFSELIAMLLEPKTDDELGLEAVRGILERSSGTMNLSAAGSSEILRIVINN